MKEQNLNKKSEATNKFKKKNFDQEKKLFQEKFVKKNTPKKIREKNKVEINWKKKKLGQNKSGKQNLDKKKLGKKN